MNKNIALAYADTLETLQKLSDEELQQKLQEAFPEHDHNPSEATIKKWQEEDAKVEMAHMEIENT
tara:strand:+ start:415 stop:609 length:195 start_codon:yes stop_codon:yes gene_type:complete